MLISSGKSGKVGVIFNKMKPYFQDKQYKFNLYLGDVFDVIKTVKKESMDMIFADPPYNLSNGGFALFTLAESKC